VLKRLQIDHLNSEKESLQKICSDYQDMFYLPGDKLSYTNTMKHCINLAPGTTPVNRIPYRLPEAQVHEVDKQVQALFLYRCGDGLSSASAEQVG
jgi:hypothetical protein